MEGTIILKETIILSSVAEGIIASLGSRPVKDIVQRWGVEDELERLKHTVSTIKSVLPDAEEQQDGNPEVRVWLETLQKPMYDADDLLDDVSSEALPDDVSSEALPEEDKKNKKLFSKLMDHAAKPFKPNQVPAQLLLEEDKKKKKECNDFSKSNQRMRTEESTPVAKPTRLWNMRTGEPRLSSRLAKKMERVDDFLPQERYRGGEGEGQINSVVVEEEDRGPENRLSICQKQFDSLSRGVGFGAYG